MAVAGVAPKPPEQRRNQNPKLQGEWITLPAEKGFAPVLAPYKRAWSMPRWMWNAWRRDTVTSQWTEADKALAMATAEHWEELAPAEQRLRMMQLGMTPAGRRALRWRTPLEEHQQVVALEKAKEIRRMRLVSEKETA